MGSHSVTCHPIQVNIPRLNPSRKGRYSVYLPGGMEGWVDLDDLLHTEMVYLPVDSHTWGYQSTKLWNLPEIGTYGGALSSTWDASARRLRHRHRGIKSSKSSQSPNDTHPSTNRAQCRLTTLTTTLRCHHYKHSDSLYCIIIINITRGTQSIRKDNIQMKTKTKHTQLTNKKSAQTYHP